MFIMKEEFALAEDLLHIGNKRHLGCTVSISACLNFFKQPSQHLPAQS